MFDKKKGDYYSTVRIKGEDHAGVFGSFDGVMFDNISPSLKQHFGSKKVIQLYDNDGKIGAVNVFIDRNNVLDVRLDN